MNNLDQEKGDDKAQQQQPQADCGSGKFFVFKRYILYAL